MNLLEQFCLPVLNESCHNYSKADGLKFERNRIPGKKNSSCLWLAAGLTANMIASMGKGRHISMETLTKFCEAMNCGIRCD